MIAVDEKRGSRTEVEGMTATSRLSIVGRHGDSQGKDSRETRKLVVVLADARRLD